MRFLQSSHGEWPVKMLATFTGGSQRVMKPSGFGPPCHVLRAPNLVRFLCLDIAVRRCLPTDFDSCVVTASPTHPTLWLCLVRVLGSSHERIDIMRFLHS